MSSVVIVVLSIVTVCVICTLVAAAIVFLRRYSRTRGDYYTQEDEGDKLAGDANMAVLKAKTGNHQVKQRQEWYI